MSRLAAPVVLGLALSAGFLAYWWAAGQRTLGGLAGIEQRRVEPDPACELRRAPCSARLDAGRELRFRIDPADIPLLQPLRLVVEVQGRQPAALTVEIVGLNMDMGLNRTGLTPDAAGNWLGRTILPVCSRSRMEWEARVRLRDPGSAFEWVVPFRFDTRR